MNNKQFSIIYPNHVMAKKLIVVNSEDIIYYLEDESGFRVLEKKEIDYLLRKNKIRFKYSEDLFTYLEIGEKNSLKVKSMI